MRLRGRRDEREALDLQLTNAFAGRSRVLMLRGEAGVCKRAPLDYVPTARLPADDWLGWTTGRH